MLYSVRSNEIKRVLYQNKVLSNILMAQKLGQNCFEGEDEPDSEEEVKDEEFKRSP